MAKQSQNLNFLSSSITLKNENDFENGDYWLRQVFIKKSQIKGINKYNQK